MTQNEVTAADAASEARGANPGFGELTETRSAFDFDRDESIDADQATAPTLKDKALTRLHSEADNRKGVVSDQLKQVSGALRAMGESDGETPQWLTNGVGQVTQFVDRIAGQIENRNAEELVADARNFARANPAAFLGAAALAGFVAVRIFSATGSGR